MTVTYHSGERIQATQADFDGIPAISGGWKEVARTTLGSAGDTISVASLPDKRYYMVLGNHLPSGNFRTTYRLNNDSGSNYALRKSEDGGSENVTTSITDITSGNEDTNTQYFDVSYLSNLSAKEKLMINHNMRSGGTGAGNAPKRVEAVSKWANTSIVINRIDAVNDQGGDYASGSEVVVLGWDPDDTHTTNFWEQLASVEGDGTSTTISSGTIPARKYLWVQAFTNASSQNTGFQFNNDTGNNYTIRRSTNGGTDATETSIGYIEGSDTSKAFTNMFIINNSANEKLTIGQSIHNPTAGAGTAPTRNEVAGKWTNTSAQITEIDYMQQTTSVNFPSGSFIKVWGSN